MAWEESWQLKVRRRFRKPFNKIVHGSRPFISRYQGADFLLRPGWVNTLEISAKIAERPELANFKRLCADLRPDVFVDIGANIGLYSCILLKNAVVPRAVLFEPDHQNLIQLKANLLINDLINSVQIHEAALGDSDESLCLLPNSADGGFSRIVDGPPPGGCYSVTGRRLDDMLLLANQKLAIKIDVEGYECRVLAGMKRTLRENRCIVQIEAFETREQVFSLMTTAGYAPIRSFAPNFVFATAALSRAQQVA